MFLNIFVGIYVSKSFHLRRKQMDSHMAIGVKKQLYNDIKVFSNTSADTNDQIISTSHIKMKL